MDETFEEEDCFFVDLKPGGGLKAFGSTNETWDGLEKRVSELRKADPLESFVSYFLLDRLSAVVSISGSLLADCSSSPESLPLSLLSLPEPDSLSDPELDDPSALCFT